LQKSFFTQKEAMKWMEDQVNQEAQRQLDKEEFKRKNILGVLSHE
jgi:hypothetical protein